MAKLNGSLLLVYCDGTLIASQKNVTINWEQDLPDASTKASTGWEEHINGTRRATVDFDCLYDTTGMSAEELITYITGRTNLVLVIDVDTIPIVGEATVKNISINAGIEEPASFSGSFKFTGPAWMLSNPSGTYVNLITDPDGGTTDYDTLTVSGIKITSAINNAGNAYCLSNMLSTTIGDVMKCILFLTSNSGELPSVQICTSGLVARSNKVALTAGVNIVTLTATASEANLSLVFSNTAAANWATTNIYLFRV